MLERLKMGKVQPEAYRAMSALDKYISTTSIDKLHREMIKIRASQVSRQSVVISRQSTA